MREKNRDSNWKEKAHSKTDNAGEKTTTKKNMAGIPPPRVSRLDFLKQKPPPNYVAGVGRGATGFTTRSDIGGAVKQTAAGKVTVVSGGGALGGGEDEARFRPRRRKFSTPFRDENISIDRITRD